MTDLKNWKARPLPSRVKMEGQYVRLEPIDAVWHGDGLYAASTVPDAAERFRWLPEYPPESHQAFEPWLRRAESGVDPLFFTVIDKKTNVIAGRQALMRIDSANGAIEIGNVYWGPLVSRQPAATEALYLFATYVFDELGYRRFEWKCNNANEPSKRAAERFGFTFEGIFRQHMIVKGENRDTAWYSMLDSEWPVAKKAFETWLAPENFDEKGDQKMRLDTIRENLGG
ncbi:MAG: GNAT family N-acetyltransferase [Phyllobacterium sp.]